MERVLGTALSALATVSLPVAPGPAVQAATGRVVVLSVDPADGAVTTLGGRACFTPPVTVGKGYGPRVPALDAAFRA